MAALKNKRELAAFNRESQEEHPINNLSRDTNIRRVKDDDITQVLGEIDGRAISKIVSGI